ncbi:deoxyribonuclease V [Inmirania thermothiophila]|uniref:Endonuclease V n=1 Tax=Inmirania thermothiophila TaxID=1750597 RepID=A0A3N1Y7Y3_9GAMM|nr:deoxyribonuclease V [Inmirania thermothiophila]ROR34618.1 endonuclease V [Inmirania thermothiophila]
MPSQRRRIRPLHDWDVDPAEAAAIQRALAPRVVREDRLGEIRLVAGIDVGFEAAGGVTRAAVAVLSWPGLEPVDQALARRPTTFPYVPGLLSFREIPAVLEAMAALRQWPHLVLCDGQGLAHPRRFGLACHLGLVLDLPAIGVAKSRLVGTHGPLPPRRGAWVPLTEGEEVIGAVVRTRDGVRPLYVSIGHRISLASAVDWVLRCAPRYRLPETTRQAHRLASPPRAPATGSRRRSPAPP